MSMLRLFFPLSLLFCLHTAKAQTDDYRIKVIPKDSKLWGYADINGNLVIESKYKWSYSFCPEGVAVAKRDNERYYDLLDASGSLVKTEVDKLFPYIMGWNWQEIQETFHDGVMVVSLNNTGTSLAGMNQQGKLITDTKYTWLSNFENGIAIGKVDKDKHDDEYYIVKNDGSEQRLAQKGITAARELSEGLAPIQLGDEKWGFVNGDGVIEIDAQFESVGYFKGGLAWARSTDNLIGFIDKTGEWVIKPQFLSAKEFGPSSNMAMVKLEDGWRYVNRQGEIFQFNGEAKLYGFSEGLAMSRRESDRKLGFIDENGEWVIEPQFDNARDFVNGFAAVEQDRMWGLINKKGDWVIKPMFAKMMDAYPIMEN